MSLMIFDSKEDIPVGMKYVLSNDQFFILNTVLKDIDFTREVLRSIDKAEYINERMFKTREGFALPKDLLSTGSKTLLNIESHPDTCFNVQECGMNALDMLWKFRAGCVIWWDIHIFPSDTEECDIVYDKKSFVNIFNFLDYYKKKRYEELPLLSLA